MKNGRELIENVALPILHANYFEQINYCRVKTRHIFYYVYAKIFIIVLLREVMNINILKLFIVVSVINFIVPQKAFAYLDPGTGSMIVQVIIASIAGIGCTLALWKDKIIGFFKKGSKDD